MGSGGLTLQRDEADLRPHQFCISPCSLQAGVWCCPDTPNMRAESRITVSVHFGDRDGNVANSEKELEKLRRLQGKLDTVRKQLLLALI